MFTYSYSNVTTPKKERKESISRSDRTNFSFTRFTLNSKCKTVRILGRTFIPGTLFVSVRMFVYKSVHLVTKNWNFSIISLQSKRNSRSLPSVDSGGPQILRIFTYHYLYSRTVKTMTFGNLDKLQP